MIRISFSGAAAAAVLLINLSACATAPRSILLGAGSGAIAGGGVGLAISQDAGSVAMGVATGALTGSVIGYLLHQGKKGDEGAAARAEDANPYPFLTRPEVRTIWVPDTVEGNRYIEKHRVFVIDQNSSWSKDND
jgi:hypothetical protein